MHTVNHANTKVVFQYRWSLIQIALYLDTFIREIGLEMENGNGQNLVQMNVMVKLLINDHLLKTTSTQRPPLYKDHIIIMSQR